MSTLTELYNLKHERFTITSAYQLQLHLLDMSAHTKQVLRRQTNVNNCVWNGVLLWPSRSSSRVRSYSKRNRLQSDRQLPQGNNASCPGGSQPGTATPTPRTRNRKRSSARGRAAAPSASASPPPENGPRSGENRALSRQARDDPAAGGAEKAPPAAGTRVTPRTGSARSPAPFERAREAGPLTKAHRDPAAARALGTGGLLARAGPGGQAYSAPQQPEGRGAGRTHQGAAGAGHGPPGPGPLPTRSAPGARPGLSQWGARVPRPWRHHNNLPPAGGGLSAHCAPSLAARAAAHPGARPELPPAASAAEPGRGCALCGMTAPGRCVCWGRSGAGRAAAASPRPQSRVRATTAAEPWQRRAGLRERRALCAARSSSAS